MNQDELLSECLQLRTHQSLDEFHGHLKRLIGDLGFKSYLYGVLPNANREDPGETHDLSFVSNSTFDASWLEYYQERGYAQQDYLVRHCLRRDVEPCFWHLARPRMSSAQLHIYHQAVEAGCTNAVTIPVKNHSGVTGAVSVTTDGNAAELIRLFSCRGNALEMISHAFNEAILDRFFEHYTQAWKPDLTAREIEVLQWLAGGYANEQIADKMAITFPTVRKHINSAKRKLAARNSVAACVMALKWGFIR